MCGLTRWFGFVKNRVARTIRIARQNPRAKKTKKQRHMTTSTNAVVYTEEDELIYASKNDSYYLDPSAKQIGGSVIFAFIKSLDIRADLTQMKTPIVFDCGISTLERVAQVSYPNEYVVGLSKLKSPVERMLRILKISLASQIGNVNLKPNAPSKPFNPILVRT